MQINKTVTALDNLLVLFKAILKIYHGHLTINGYILILKKTNAATFEGSIQFRKIHFEFTNTLFYNKIVNIFIKPFSMRK